MRKFLLLCSASLTALTLCNPVCATVSTEMFNLLQIYDLALQSDPVLKSANDQRLAQEQAIPLAYSAFLPWVTASATQLNFMVDQGFAFITSPVETELGYNITGTEVIQQSAYTGQVTQTFFDLARFHTLKKAYRIKDEAEANYVSVAQELILRSATAYFNVLRAIDELNFVIAEKKTISRQLEEARQKFEVGMVPITDVKEWEAQLDSIRAQEIWSYNKIQSAREAVRVITGVFPERLAALKQEIPLLTPIPNDADTWAGIAEESNPRLEAARYNTQVKKQAVNIARDARFPTVNFAGQDVKQRYGTFVSPTSSPSQWQWQGLITAQMNIFTGGAITANVKKMQYEYQQSIDDLEKVRRDTVSSTENAYRDVQTTLTRVKALQKSVISNQASVDATIAGYDVGTRTTVDVLTEISKLYAQQRNLVNARYDYIISVLALKKFAGTLLSEDMLVVNELLTSKPAVITDEEKERADIDAFVGLPNKKSTNLDSREL